ncbi:MAG: low-density lipoprotein receptor class A repeat-containing protein [Candidatus Poseidoniaceae archaeon]|nr:low-density lipoprotein receptor class A repeat-containing protein [Candidatus Poseidoniaceae archaeon]
MRKALVLLMTACFLLAGCIEGLTETVEGTIDEMTPGCNDPAALNYVEDDTSDSTCMSQEMMGAAIDDFSTLMDADEPPADMGIKITMAGVDEDMDMGAYTVVATTAENENTVYSGSDITISSMGMTISQAWTITSSDDGGTLIQATYMDQSFLMSSAMSMEDVVAAGAEETEEQSSGEMDMPGAADMVTMLGAWDGCVECPMPTAHAYDPLDGGLTVTYMVDAQDIEMGFSMNADGTWVMTSYSYDTGNESMGVEILSGEEVAALLMIDTTLGYEALPFTLEEADAEDTDSVFICGDGEEIPADWENDGFADCSDGSDENIHDWTDYDGGYCEWISEDTWCKCKYSEEDEDWDSMWYYCENHDVDWHCTDDKGQSADYEHSANGTEWSEPEIFVCDNGDEIPMSDVNDGWDDCGDNSDEGVEEQEEGSVNRTFTVTSDAEFAFAGSFEDYSIVLANCVEETDDMGDTTLTCDEDNSTMYSLGEPEAHDDTTAAVYLSYGDSDSSGTLTNGDTIMIDGNTSVDWTHLRLHSTSADAYSDENPLQELPGFTALLSVLSLIGAAMIGRRD